MTFFSLCRYAWGTRVGMAWLVAFLLLPLGIRGVGAEDAMIEFDKVSSKLTGEKYQLRYRFQSDEEVFYEVVHQSVVKTKVEANTEEVKSRSKSLKKWAFSDVQPNHDATFAYSVEFVNMWSTMEGREPQRYDSRIDKEIPPEYQGIANTLRKPVSVLTVAENGEILHREDQIKQIDRGTGGLITPLPKQPVSIGAEWSVPSVVSVQHGDGRRQAVKTRQLYRLEKVAAGVATISLTTQVLTPVSDAKVKSQLIQKLSKGEIKFDIDAGRMISKQLFWDETVIGFNGAQSSMAFLARMTERLVPENEVAALQKNSETR